MIKYRANCKVCIKIKEDESLMHRIYNSKYYIPGAKDSLSAIARDYNEKEPGVFHYLGLIRHCKNHQTISQTRYTQKMMVKKLKNADIKILQSKFDALNVQDAVINAGMEKLELGELRVDTKDLLRAARDKQDGQAKIRDQQLALAEMVAFYTSASDNLGSEKINDKRDFTIEEYDPSIPVTEDSDSWAK